MPPIGRPSSGSSSATAPGGTADPRRRALEHRPLARLEAVDARREKRVNRRRHGLVCGVGIVGEHGEHLLDEERVALGRVDDAIAERGSDQPRRRRAPRSAPRTRRRSTARGRRSSCGAGAPPRTGERRAGRAREAEEQDRAPLEKPSDVLEQVEQRRLGPVDVVHRDDERSRGRERLEQPAERPRGLLRRARLVVGADRARDQHSRIRTALDVLQELRRARRGSAAALAHDLSEGSR